MSDEELALLRAIVEQFDDDVPRLVYADWLEEHDQSPRAEFIRLQCHLHQALMNPNQREHFSRLVDNMQDFRSQHDEADIFVAKPEFFFGEWGEHDRGFPERLEIDCRSREGYNEGNIEELRSVFVPISRLVIEVDQLVIFQMIMTENLLRMCQFVEIGPRTCGDSGIIPQLFEGLMETEWPRNVRAVRFAAWPVGSLWIQMLMEGNLHSLPKLSFPRAEYQAASLYPELRTRLPDRVQLH